jgi:hypothetical protein
LIVGQILIGFDAIKRFVPGRSATELLIAAAPSRLASGGVRQAWFPRRSRPRQKTPSPSASSRKAK